MPEVLAAHSADGSAASKRESPFSLSVSKRVCPRFLPGHWPREQTPASSRLRTQSKRTNATLKPTLTTVSHGPQPRLARQWPLPWPEASRTGTRWNEREWYRDGPSIDRIGKAIPRSRTAQPVKKPKMRATPPGSKHSGPHVHIQRVLFSSSFPLSLRAL